MEKTNVNINDINEIEDPESLPILDPNKDVALGSPDKEPPPGKESAYVKRKPR